MSHRAPKVASETDFHLEGYANLCSLSIAEWFRKRSRHLDAEGLANEVLQKLGAFVHKHDAQDFSEDRVLSLRHIICRQVLGREIRRWKAKKRSGDSRDKATLSLHDLMLSVPVSLLSTLHDRVEFADWLRYLCEPLSNRERQIVEWRLEGWTLSEIAKKVSLSDSTVDRCMEKIRSLIGSQIENDLARTKNKEQRTKNKEQRKCQIWVIPKIRDAKMVHFAFTLLAVYATAIWRGEKASLATQSWCRCL